MARAGLGWSTDELAKRSGVSARTVLRFEGGESLKPETVLEMAKALVSGGAMFVEIDGKQGVLLHGLQ